MKKIYTPYLSRPAGFTLAELLVSIGLIILFTGLLLPAFSRFGRRNELRQTAQLIQTRILETKAFALAPRASGGTAIVAYRFTAPVLAPLPGCAAGSSTYALEEITTSSSTVILCQSLPLGLAFINAATTASFSVVRQGAVMEPTPPNESRFRIQHGDLNPPNRQDIVVVRATGQVTISDPY